MNKTLNAIFENIFSLKEDENLTKLTLLGIKFKKKKHLQIEDVAVLLEQFFMQSWLKNLMNENFSQFFEQTIELSGSKNVLSENIFLANLCYFLEKNDTKNAQKYFEKYCSIYPQKSKLAQFLPVANLAYEQGIKNDEITFSKDLFKKFDNAYKNEIFANEIYGKSIAVVGNGEQELGKKKGREIDSHDVVIRFNRYGTGTWEEDYGAKVDIWCKNFETTKLGNWVKSPLNIYKGDIWHNAYVNIDKLCQNKEILSEKVDYINADVIKFCEKYYNPGGFYSQTLGFYIALWILKCRQSFDNVDFYGFSFLEDEYKGCFHYYEDNSDNQENIQKFHHHMQESCILKKLIQGKDMSQKG